MKQLNIADVLQEDGAERNLLQNTKKCEMDLTRRLDSCLCVVDCLKTHLNGEDGGAIVGKMKLGRRKTEYLSKHNVAKTYLQETIKLLQECDAFSIGFDESEMNKHHECEVMVMLSQG